MNWLSCRHSLAVNRKELIVKRIILCSLILILMFGVANAQSIITVDEQSRQVVVLFARLAQRAGDFGIVITKDPSGHRYEGQETFVFHDVGVMGSSVDGALYSITSTEKTSPGLPAALLLISCLTTNTDKYLESIEANRFQEQLRINAFLNQMLQNDQMPEYGGSQYTNEQGFFFNIREHDEYTTFSVHFDPT